MNESHPLKSYRERQEPPLTQEDLAKMIGVGKSTISRWEDGKRKIDDELVGVVTEITGIPPAELRPDLAKLFAPEAAAT
jgi:transcriptional regulator with XRE-family HTH domain